MGCPGRRGLRGIKEEKESGEAGRHAEDNAGGDVATAQPLDADEIHGPGSEHSPAHESHQWADTGEKSPGASGGGDVGERVARERLTAHHSKDAHHGRDHRGERTNYHRGAHRCAGEEAGLEEESHGRSTHRQIRVFGNVVVVPPRLGHDEDAAVNLQHVDVMTVKFA